MFAVRRVPVSFGKRGKTRTWFRSETRKVNGSWKLVPATDDSVVW